MAQMGRILAGLGAVLLLAGLALMWLPGLRLGQLPGDLTIQLKNGRIYLPLGTCLVISVLISLGFWLLGLLRR